MIDQITKNDAYCHHPTPLKYGAESYISVLTRLIDGQSFGTLCAIDPKPARVEILPSVGCSSSSPISSLWTSTHSTVDAEKPLTPCEGLVALGQPISIGSSDGPVCCGTPAD